MVVGGVSDSLLIGLKDQPVLIHFFEVRFRSSKTAKNLSTCIFVLKLRLRRFESFSAASLCKKTNIPNLEDLKVCR